MAQRVVKLAAVCGLPDGGLWWCKLVMVRKRKKSSFECDARKIGMRSGVIDRSKLSFEPAAVNYRTEAGLSGRRPLPLAIRDGSWQSLVAATGLDAVDAPAFRFISTPVIADAVGIDAGTLREHKRKPGFPRHVLRQVGWLVVADTDGVAAIAEWLRTRRVGPAKNHIKKRDRRGRAKG